MLWILLSGPFGWSFGEPPPHWDLLLLMPWFRLCENWLPLYPVSPGSRAPWVRTTHHLSFDERSALMRSLPEDLSPAFHGRTPAFLAPLSSRYVGCSHPPSPLALLRPPRHSSQVLAFKYVSGENQAPLLIPQSQGVQIKLSNGSPPCLAGKSSNFSSPKGSGGAVLSIPASLANFSHSPAHTPLLAQPEGLG